MIIAKGVQAQDYLDLDLSDLNSSNWDTAFDYMYRRLTERFIEPVDKLIDFEKDLPAGAKKYGFAVMAINCLLCETLQAFYEGVTDSTGHSKRLFTAFLTKRSNFNRYFTNPQDAVDFYKNFRCGILHQAQTSADTKIWAVGDLIKRTGKYVIVNRILFHEKLKGELDIYLSTLKQKKDPILMNNFKTKMDFICDR